VSCERSEAISVRQTAWDNSEIASLRSQ